MAASLARPGVEVTQTFKSTSPTVVTPTLVPCVVGLCRQLVDVLSADSSGGSQLNGDALVALPALFEAASATGSPPSYGGLDGLDLVLSVNHGPDVTITLAGSSISPRNMVSQIKGAFATAGVTEATAVLVGNGFLVKTIGANDFQTLEIRPTTDTAVLTALGLTPGYLYGGHSTYQQNLQTILPASFPDPRGNLSQVSIEANSVRVFLALGAGVNLQELSRTESLLRKGGAGTVPSITGTVALSTGGLYGGGGSLNGKKLNIKVDQDDPVVVTFSSPVAASDLLQQVNAALGRRLAVSNTGLKLSSGGSGVAHSIAVVADADPTSDARTALGFGASNSAATGVAGVLVIDDGNGDALSPLVQIPGENFAASPAAASVTGLVDTSTLSYPGDLSGKTLILAALGNDPQTFTFDGTILSSNLVTQLNGFFAGIGLVASLSGGLLHLETNGALPLGEESTIDIIGGTALGVLGLTPSVTSASGVVAALAPDPTVLNGKKFKIAAGGTTAEVTFSGLLSGDALSAIVALLNASGPFSTIAVAAVSGSAIQIRSKTGGKGQSIRVVAASSADAATYLGFSIGQTGTADHYEGVPYKPVSGDDLYVDGSLIGRITQVSVGGDNSVLKIAKQLTISSDLGDHFVIRAKNLSTSSTRPTPELVVEGDGTAVLKANLLRDPNGVPFQAKSRVYLSYRGVRQDVTAKAKNPGLFTFASLTEIDDLISPRSTLNPLALGAQFAIQNAPGGQITALGVDEISADSPEGTPDAFTRAFELLESQEVYAIAPLTHDETVGALLAAHVTAMSAPDQKGERIAVLNPSVPTKRIDKLVASGQGNTQGASGIAFDTGVSGLPQFVLAQGVDPIGSIDVSSGLFLDIASNAKHYSISSVVGGVVFIRTSFLAGENDDGFYATTDLNDSPLPSALIDENFSVKIRGASLTLPDGSTDKTGIAATMASLAQTYLNRRVTMLFPDKCSASVNGLEQEIEGYYMAAARAGMIGKQSPSQSFTNFPMVGFTGVQGSGDTFSKKQLAQIRAGGVDIIVQDSPGTPLISSMALTTDMTSIALRTDSIQKVVDYTSKFVRRGLQSFIGRFNISTGFIDTLGHVIQGLLGFLVENGILNGAQLVEIVQDPVETDSCAVVLRILPPTPCNYIRVELVI